MFHKKTRYSLLGIIFCLHFSLCSIDVVQSGSRIERGVLEMYEEDNLGDCCLFTGNFINFGYWENSTNPEEITVQQRLESSAALYMKVAGSARISENDVVLEVGCGQGAGAGLIRRTFKPRSYLGVDFSPSQIKHAEKKNRDLLDAEQCGLFFECASAEQLPLAPSSCDVVLSVEAAQHFSDINQFIHESHRVLKPGGRFIVTTFFSSSPQSSEALPSMIQTVRDGIDKIHPIEEVEQMLLSAGYTNIKIETIGKNVWKAFDVWVSQGELKSSWTRNWFKAYKDRLIDYYIVSAEKPLHSITIATSNDCGSGNDF